MAAGHKVSGTRSETIAQQLQRAILAGELGPGQRLDEAELGERLGASRNTLREAFRLLAHDRLVEHEAHRGVFVSTVDSDRARQVYAVRRHLELGALDEVLVMLSEGQSTLGQLAPEALADIQKSVAAAQVAAEEGEWVGVGTANGDFHLALVALSGNSVAIRIMQSLVGETRLRFLALGNPRAVHERFVQENLRIAELLAAGHVARARAGLELYLLRAEEQLT